MKTEELGEEGFKEHLVVLTNGVRLHEWLASLCRGKQHYDGDKQSMGTSLALNISMRSL